VGHNSAPHRRLGAGRPAWPWPRRRTPAVVAGRSVPGGATTWTERGHRRQGTRVRQHHAQTSRGQHCGRGFAQRVQMCSDDRCSFPGSAVARHPRPPGVPGVHGYPRYGPRRAVLPRPFSRVSQKPTPVSPRVGGEEHGGVVIRRGTVGPGFALSGGVDDAESPGSGSPPEGASTRRIGAVTRRVQRPNDS
jgi:hypothetical protein